MGEEFPGAEKLGLAPKVLQNLWGYAEPFFNRLFGYVKRSAEPSCRTPKVPQNSGEPLGARARLSRTGFQKRPFVHNSVCSQFLDGLFAILAECSQFCLRSF